jgi:hypothetical protein
MKIRKYVTVGGLKWAVISANERSVTHADRHFFSCRCYPSGPWSIYEHDCDIAQTGSAKPLLVFANDYETRELSDAVQKICAGSQLHPSRTFEEHRAAMKARFDRNQGKA